MAHFGYGEYSRSNENALATLCVCIGLRNMWQSGFARNGKIVTTGHVSTPPARAPPAGCP